MRHQESQIISGQRSPSSFEAYVRRDGLGAVLVDTGRRLSHEALEVAIIKLAGQFSFIGRGIIDIKGNGPMQTYLLQRNGEGVQYAA